MVCQEELQTVTSIHVVDEHNAFTLDEPQLENDVCQQELVDLGALDVILRQIRCLVLLFLQSEYRLRCCSIHGSVVHVGYTPDSSE